MLEEWKLLNLVRLFTESHFCVWLWMCLCFACPLCFSINDIALEFLTRVYEHFVPRVMLILQPTCNPGDEWMEWHKMDWNLYWIVHRPLCLFAVKYESKVHKYTVFVPLFKVYYYRKVYFHIYSEVGELLNRNVRNWLRFRERVVWLYKSEVCKYYIKIYVYKVQLK